MKNVGRIIYENDFFQDNGHFALEGGGDVEFGDGKLILDDTKAITGLTMWLKMDLPASCRITYEAVVLEPEMANNLNFFLMARTLDNEPVWTEHHSGEYGEYHRTCDMYVFTHTGNYIADKPDMGWSRLRKDPGFNLVSERMDCKANIGVRYAYEFIIDQGTIQSRINGVDVHHYVDPDGYKQGAVGFRTWKTRLQIEKFRIYSLDDEN